MEDKSQQHHLGSPQPSSLSLAVGPRLWLQLEGRDVRSRMESSTKISQESTGQCKKTN